ncbi:hypothetical protein PRIPAC_95575, partial [Pristionchus pacificus]|uniref:ShK domain-containing protein n=1 Tax=Pristionchus pacificus TaxID=54126 RepID=A0A2A6D1N4_PRIPA
MRDFFLVVLLLEFHHRVAAQCTPSQHPNCVHWVRNGFCENRGYTIPQRQSYCGISCGLCDSDGGPLCILDADPYCPYWAANGFCNSTKYPHSTKKEICCKSCAEQSTPMTTGSFTGTPNNDFYYF